MAHDFYKEKPFGEDSLRDFARARTPAYLRPKTDEESKEIAQRRTETDKWWSLYSDNFLNS